jgi:N-glycosylase/DNA lyase
LSNGFKQIILNQNTPIALDHTLNCGQVFRWRKKGNYWYGVVRDTVVKLRQDQNKLIFKTYPEDIAADFLINYLRLEDNLPLILSKIDKDPIIKSAIKHSYGLRIIRQDPWECLISYMCATFSNLVRIKQMIQYLSKKFGKELIYDGYTFYSFPKIEDLVEAGLEDLLNCKLGFRAKYIQKTSKYVDTNKLDLKGLCCLPYIEAKKELLDISGVGHKVADCVLLFSLDKLEAFPIDVWINRIMSKHYYRYLPHVKYRQKYLTTKRYKQISSFGRDYFGKFAGYAQEYLFYYYRSL